MTNSEIILFVALGIPMFLVIIFFSLLIMVQIKDLWKDLFWDKYGS